MPAQKFDWMPRRGRDVRDDRRNGDPNSPPIRDRHHDGEESFAAVAMRKMREDLERTKPQEGSGLVVVGIIIGVALVVRLLTYGRPISDRPSPNRASNHWQPEGQSATWGSTGKN